VSGLHVLLGIGSVVAVLMGAWRYTSWSDAWLRREAERRSQRLEWRAARGHARRRIALTPHREVPAPWLRRGKR
jgi:hypothetical protein